MFRRASSFVGGYGGGCFRLTMEFFFLFFLFSSTTNTPCHPERVKGARDLVLQALHSHSCSLLLLHTVFSCSLLSSPCASAPLQITLTFQQILFVHFGLCLCYTNFAIRFFVFRSQHFLL